MSESKTYECCGQAFSTKEEMEAHNKKYHSQCSCCK